MKITFLISSVLTLGLTAPSSFAFQAGGFAHQKECEELDNPLAPMKVASSGCHKNQDPLSNSNINFVAFQQHGALDWQAYATKNTLLLMEEQQKNYRRIAGQIDNPGKGDCRLRPSKLEGSGDPHAQVRRVWLQAKSMAAQQYQIEKANGILRQVEHTLKRKDLSLKQRRNLSALKNYISKTENQRQKALEATRKGLLGIDFVAEPTVSQLVSELRKSEHGRRPYWHSPPYTAQSRQALLKEFNINANRKLSKQTALRALAVKRDSSLQRLEKKEGAFYCKLKKNIEEVHKYVQVNINDNRKTLKKIQDFQKSKHRDDPQRAYQLASEITKNPEHLRQLIESSRHVFDFSRYKKNQELLRAGHCWAEKALVRAEHSIPSRIADATLTAGLGAVGLVSTGAIRRHGLKEAAKLGRKKFNKAKDLAMRYLNVADSTLAARLGTFLALDVGLYTLVDRPEMNRMGKTCSTYLSMALVATRETRDENFKKANDCHSELSDLTTMATAGLALGGAGAAGDIGIAGYRIAKALKNTPFKRHLEELGLTTQQATGKVNKATRRFIDKHFGKNIEKIVEHDPSLRPILDANILGLQVQRIRGKDVYFNRPRFIKRVNQALEDAGSACNVPGFKRAS